MPCYIGAKHMTVTFKIVTEGVRPQFVELFPRGMTVGVGPVGIRRMMQTPWLTCVLAQDMVDGCEASSEH